MVSLKKKEFVPCGSKFCPFRVDPFLEKASCAHEQTGNHKSCPSCQKWWTIAQEYPSILNKIRAISRTSNMFYVPLLKPVYLADITKTRLFKYIEPEKEKIQIKKSYIFLISVQNIDCGYSLEPPRLHYL